MMALQSHSESMHARADGAVPLKKRAKRAPRIELSFESQTWAAIEQRCQRTGISPQEFAHGAVARALNPKSGAWEKAVLAAQDNELQRAADFMFRLLQQIAGTKLIASPPTSISDHVAEVVASAELRDIRSKLDSLLRHVAAMVCMRKGRDPRDTSH